MIRKIKKSDEQDYLKLAEEFYSSEAVLHSVDPNHFAITFAEMMRSDMYAEGFIFEEDNQIAGYALVAKTFSQEAGGVVTWIEEIYVRPEFQGRGIGKQFFEEYVHGLGEEVARVRLEVEPDNERAVALYTKYGFTPLGYSQMIKKV